MPATTRRAVVFVVFTWLVLVQAVDQDPVMSGQPSVEPNPSQIQTTQTTQTTTTQTPTTQIQPSASSSSSSSNVLTSTEPATLAPTARAQRAKSSPTPQIRREEDPTKQKTRATSAPIHANADSSQSTDMGTSASKSTSAVIIIGCLACIFAAIGIAVVGIKQLSRKSQSGGDGEDGDEPHYTCQDKMHTPMMSPPVVVNSTTRLSRQGAASSTHTPLSFCVMAESDSLSQVDIIQTNGKDKQQKQQQQPGAEQQQARSQGGHILLESVGPGLYAM